MNPTLLIYLNFPFVRKLILIYVGIYFMLFIFNLIKRLSRERDGK